MAEDSSATTTPKQLIDMVLIVIPNATIFASDKSKWNDRPVSKIPGITSKPISPLLRKKLKSLNHSRPWGISDYVSNPILPPLSTKYIP